MNPFSAYPAPGLDIPHSFWHLVFPLAACGTAVLFASVFLYHFLRYATLPVH